MNEFEMHGEGVYSQLENSVPGWMIVHEIAYLVHNLVDNNKKISICLANLFYQLLKDEIYGIFGLSENEFTVKIFPSYQLNERIMVISASFNMASDFFIDLKSSYSESELQNKINQLINIIKLKVGEVNQSNSVFKLEIDYQYEGQIEEFLNAQHLNIVLKKKVNEDKTGNASIIETSGHDPDDS